MTTGINKFAAYVQSMNGPAFGVFAVTPHDTNELSIWTRAIRVSGAGNVALVGADGVACTCAFLAGETRSIQAKIIKDTGTTCTGIEGMY